MPKAAKHAATVLLFAVSLVAGIRAASAADIEIKDAWSRATPPGIEVGVAYLVIDSRGKPDRLLSVSSPIAKKTEFHISEMADGLMTMRHLDAVDIKADKPTEFAPGGRHIMLIGLKHQLKDGDKFPLTLTFKDAGPIKVTVPVYGIGKAPDQSK